MSTVRTPVAGYTGDVVGVTFTDGVGETTDPAALAYFARQGYQVGEPEPEPEPEKPQRSRATKTATK